MLFSALIAAAAILADTTPAAAPAAAAQAAAPAEAAAPAKTEKPKLICHSEAVVGSLFPKKTCYTEDQASQRRKEGQQNLEQIQQQSHR